jgi:Putative general bacterial porin
MKISKTILSTAVLFASSLSFANTYNAELGASYSDIDGDASIIAVRGIYNFTAVDTSNKPLAEAAFLGKHSHLLATYAQLDVDGGGNADAIGIGAGIFIPDIMLFIGLSHAENEVNGDDVDVNSLQLGITPLDGLLVSTFYTEDVDYEPNIAAKYVRPLSDDTAVNLEASYAQGPDGADDTIGLAGDYYFTNFFSVGASYVNQSALSDEATTAIRTRYFFNDDFSLNGEYASNDGANTMTIGAAFRF